MTEKKKVSWVDKIDLLVAIAGLALATFSYSYSTRTARAVEIAQSKPLLYIEYNKADLNKENGLLLENLGDGIAEIIDFNIYVDSIQYVKNKPHKEWFKPDNSFIFDQEVYYKDLTKLVKGSLIKNDRSGGYKLIYTDKSELLKKDDENREPRKLQFTTTKDYECICKLIIEIKYRSLLSIDKEEYVLTFSESFVENNMRGEVLDREKIGYEDGC